MISAGVVGLAMAAALGKAGRSVWLFEQNSSPGRETTSRNSEGRTPLLLFVSDCP